MDTIVVSTQRTRVVVGFFLLWGGGFRTLFGFRKSICSRGGFPRFEERTLERNGVIRKRETLSWAMARGGFTNIAHRGITTGTQLLVKGMKPFVF